MFVNKTFIDLFAGIGGFRQSLERKGATCVFSSEKNKYAAQTYFDNYGDKPQGDITLIKSEDIPRHNILCAGFPCQPFSVSGKQRGFEDSRGTMFFEIIRIANYHKPDILFLENVANLEKHKDNSTFNQMRDMLIEIGYNVYYKVLNASDYNVPQSRKRVYILCFRNDLNITEFKFPNKEEASIFLEDILEDDSITSKYVIDRDDIKFKDKEFIDGIKKVNKPVRIGTINKGGQGDRIYSPKGHAITLSAEGGGSGSKTGAYLVNGKVRKLSPRECARVQGFPESFKITVSDSQAWKQFGNSVAIPVLDRILDELLKVYR